MIVYLLRFKDIKKTTSLKILRHKTVVYIDELEEENKTDEFIKKINNKNSIVIFGIQLEKMILEDKELMYYYSTKLDNVHSIYNDIQYLNIIYDKYETYQVFSKKKNLIVPKFKEVKSIEDIKKDISYPIILCSNKSCGGENMFICDDYNKINDSFTILNKNKNQGNVHNNVNYFDKIIMKEFIESKIDNYNLQIRLFILDKTILEIRSRPSYKRIIHTKDQIIDEKILIYCQNYLNNWSKENIKYLDKCINDIVECIGKGFWAIDLLLKDDKLYLCEFEYKYWDSTYSAFCLKHNLTFKDEDMKNHIQKINDHFEDLCKMDNTQPPDNT